MPHEFLSLTESNRYTGKSRSSLRRFVEAIVKQDQHPDRHHLLPTVEEVIEIKAANHPFSWRISQELLDREFPPKTVNSSDAAEGTKPPTELVRVLEKSISLLETELTEKNRQISQFQERQRETNYLLKQATEKLLATSSNLIEDQHPASEAATSASQFRDRRHALDRDDNARSKPKRKTVWQILTTPL